MFEPRTDAIEMLNLPLIPARTMNESQPPLRPYVYGRSSRRAFLAIGKAYRDLMLNPNSE